MHTTNVERLTAGIESELRDELLDAIADAAEHVEQAIAVLAEAIATASGVMSDAGAAIGRVVATVDGPAGTESLRAALWGLVGCERFDAAARRLDDLAGQLD